MDVESTLPNFKDITTNIFKTMENFYDMRCRFEVKNLNEIEKLNTLMKTQCIEIYNKK